MWRCQGNPGIWPCSYCQTSLSSKIGYIHSDLSGPWPVWILTILGICPGPCPETLCSSCFFWHIHKNRRLNDFVFLKTLSIDKVGVFSGATKYKYTLVHEDFTQTFNILGFIVAAQGLSMSKGLWVVIIRHLTWYYNGKPCSGVRWCNCLYWLNPEGNLESEIAPSP